MPRYFLKNLPLNLALFGGIVIAIICGVSLLMLEERTDERRDWVDHTYDVLMTLREVDLLVAEAEVGERGYLLTGDQAFLDPHATSREQIKERLNALEALVKDNPSQEARATLLESAIDSKYEKMETAIGGYKRGDLNRVLETLRPRGGVDPITMIRSISHDMENAELELLAIRHQQAAQSDTYVIYTTVAFLIFALGAVLIGARQSAKARQERVANAAKIKESEQRYRLLADNSTDIIVLENFQSRQQNYISPACCTVLGYENGALIRFEDLVHPDDFNSYQADRSSLSTDAPLVTTICRVQKENGTYIWMEVRSRYVPAGGDQPARIISTWRDITQRKQAESQAEQARLTAEQANRAKSTFLAMMSHELRTPMTGVIGLADLLLMSDLTSDQADMMQRLLRSAQTLLDILNDILDFSKIEAGKLELESVPFNVSEILSDVGHLFAPQAASKGLKFAIESDPNSHDTVLGDPKRLRQIIVNLINNALKFTSRGNVTLRARQDWISTTRVLLIVAVSDSGIGIPREIADRLFQPFMQADVSTARKFGGTGLGLSICRQLVTGMGGEISLESIPNEGSTFTIRIPLTVSDLLQKAPESTLKITTPQRPLKILLAEDTETTRVLMVAMMKRLGHAIDDVADGIEAVKLAKSRIYDVVLMDMQMPLMDGVAATTEIRKQSGRHGLVPVIALTADALIEHHTRYLEAGANIVVTKPVDWALLNRAMAQLTQTSELPTLAQASATHEIVLDRKMLNTLEDALGREAFASLLKNFCDSLSNYSVKLADAITNQDIGEAKKIAHAIKGLSLQFGATKVSSIANEIETTDITISDIQANLPRMSAGVAAVLKELT